jgi:hypothetical protein
MNEAPATRSGASFVRRDQDGPGADDWCSSPTARSAARIATVATGDHARHPRPRLTPGATPSPQGCVRLSAKHPRRPWIPCAPLHREGSAMPALIRPTYRYTDPALPPPTPGAALVMEVGLVFSRPGIGPEGGGRHGGIPPRHRPEGRRPARRHPAVDRPDRHPAAPARRHRTAPAEHRSAALAHPVPDGRPPPRRRRPPPPAGLGMVGLDTRRPRHP